MYTNHKYLLMLCLGYSFSNIFSRNYLEYNLIESKENIHIVPRSEKIGHTWSNGNVWEKHLINKFYNLLPNDEFFVVFDLGAQTGCFSLMSKFFPNSSWYSFEPIKEAAEVLKENLSLNNISNVEVYQKAVMDYSGKIILNMPDMGNWGLSTIGSDVLRFDNVNEKREIECMTLDDFVKEKQIKKVHFMKLDTEGAELYILKGCKETILRDHPIILMEYNETNMKQCGVKKIEIDNFLTEMGYEWKLISSEDILCTPKH